MKFSPHRTVTTIRSVQSGLWSPLVLSTWEYFNLGVFLTGSVSSENCAHDILSSKDFVNEWLLPLLILHTFGSVNMALCPYRNFSN